MNCSIRHRLIGLAVMGDLRRLRKAALFVKQLLKGSCDGNISPTRTLLLLLLLLLPPTLQDLLLDTLHWIRQIIAVVIGVAAGVLGLTGGIPFIM